MIRFNKNGVDYDFHELPDMAQDDVDRVFKNMGVESPSELKRKQEAERLRLERERLAAEEAARKKLEEELAANGIPTVAITKQELGSMVITYTNPGKNTANLKCRVGSTDRPDRAVPAGKTVISTYTTTVKTGFTGQRFLVGWVEGNVTIFDKVL